MPPQQMLISESIWYPVTPTMSIFSRNKNNKYKFNEIYFFKEEKSAIWDNIDINDEHCWKLNKPNTKRQILNGVTCICVCVHSITSNSVTP